MRDCQRADELRAALAAQEPLSPELDGHADRCGSCTSIRASTRRFESSLDAAAADLVTDALPASTVAVARTAPKPAGRWSAPRSVAGGLLAVAMAGFAVVGLVTAGVSLSMAMFGAPPSGMAAPNEGTEAVDCYLGDPVVEVTSERSGGTGPQMVVAYCIGDVDGRATIGGDAVSCVRSLGQGGAARLDDSSPGASAAYLGACTRVEEAFAAGSPDLDETVIVAPTTPFRTWAAARDAVDWPVRDPAWLPDGYELAALQGFGADNSPSAIDSVVATYLRNGVPMAIEQFVIAEPDAFRIELTIPGNDLGEVTTGRTTVDGHPALWADGVIVETSIGQGLRVDTRVLTWADGNVGYRLTARDTELEVLRRVAESLGDG